MALVNPTQVDPNTEANASDVNTPINQLADQINGNIEAVNLASGSVTKDKLSLPKTVDSNGWTVYDYGSWKEYSHIWTGLSGSLAAGIAINVVSNVALPSGIGATELIPSIYGNANGAGVSWITYYFNGLDVTNSTATQTFSLAARNTSSSTQTLTGGWVEVRFIER